MMINFTSYTHHYGLQNYTHGDIMMSLNRVSVETQNLSKELT